MANIRKTFNFREGVKVDDSVLVVAGQRVGIGSTMPSKVLDINGDVISSGQVTVSKLVVTGVSTFSDVKIGTGITIQASSGIITANKFFGDGATLSNLPTSQWIDTDVGLGFTSIYNEGNVGVGTTDPRFTFQVGSNPNLVGKFGVGINSLTGDIKSSGIITATSFVGDGSSLENLTSGNISGTVANANIAQYAHVAGIATLAQGLTGTPDIHVGYVTATSANYSGVVTATTFVGALSGNATSSTVTSSLNSNLNYSIGVTKILSAGIGSFVSVGIGTTNPQTDLQIVNANNSVITLGRSTSATGNNGAISFGKVINSFPYSGATSLDILNYGRGNINFYLEAGNLGINTGDFHWHRRGNFSQLMTLTHRGLLGIGNTEPDHNLHVVGTSTVTSNAFFGSNVEIKGDANVTGTLTFGSATFGNITANRVNAVLLIGNSYNTSGISTFFNVDVSNDLGVTKSIGIGTDASNNSEIPVTINPLGNDSDPNKSSRILITDQGRIGIKTTEISDGVGVDAIECISIFGNVGVGTTIPGKAAVDFSDAGKIGITTTNRFMLPPILTNSERSNIFQLQAGALIYNATDSVLQVYDGSQWQTASSGGVQGITAVVQDTTPELGGHLNANNKDIYGVSNLNVTGISTFAGITTVTGETLFTKQLNASGVSTFTGAMTVANGSGVIEDSGGQLKIKASTFNFKNNLDNKIILFATGTGGVDLYNQGNKKFETTASGATVTGILVADGFEKSDGTPIAGGVGIKTAGGNVGFGITFLDFRGSAIGQITPPFSGISTINITGTGGGGGGTVTSIDISSTTLNSTGGPITGSGSISVEMPNTGVSAGSYTNADITVDAQGRVTAASDGSGGGGTTKIATIRDVKPNSTNGGAVSSTNTWIVRDLNTVSDPNSLGITSTSGGTFSLPAGTYSIDFRAPGFHVNEFQARLAYNTDSLFPPGTNYVYGSSQFSGWYTTQGQGIESHSTDESCGDTVVTLTQTTYFRIEQNNATDANGANYCLGVDANKGNDEVYTQVRIQDLATNSGGGNGTITAVNAGTGLSGGGSAGSVTLDIANTSVTAGSYTNADITVDPQGRITSASSGSGGGITIQDEGSALSTQATTLNFAGAGVVASGTGATKTITISGGGGSGGTVSSGNFTAQVGTPSQLESYQYGSSELVFEYTVFVKNGVNYQSQKLLVMRDGTTVTSTQYGIMYSSVLLVQLDATINGSNLELRATPESGVTGNTTYRIKREVT